MKCMEEIPQYVMNVVNIYVMLVSVFLSVSMGFLINLYLSLRKGEKRLLNELKGFWRDHTRKSWERFMKEMLTRYIPPPENLWYAENILLEEIKRGQRLPRYYKIIQ